MLSTHFIYAKLRSMKKDDILHIRFNRKLKGLAKRVAKKRKISVSQLVENSVVEEVGREIGYNNLPGSSEE